MPSVPCSSMTIGRFSQITVNALMRVRMHVLDMLGDALI